MLGGSTSAGGRWSLGAKTYRAPTEGERIREQQDRMARERERRKLEELKHEQKHIRKAQELQREVSRANARALGLELGSRSPMLSSGSIGIPRSPRVRSSSFSGVRSPGMFSLGSPAGGFGMAAGRDAARLEAARLQAEEARRREGDLARVRAQRHQLEAEAARRERTASAMRRERAELAIANERILSSPRLHGVHAGGLPLNHSHGLGVPCVTGGLRRTRSWSGNLPHAGIGRSPSPRLIPVGVPVPVHHGHSPRVNISPRLLPVGVGGVGMGGVGRVRTPSPGRMGLSPHLGHSPHIIHNHNTYNISPRMQHLDAAGGGYGGLGPLDDLADGGGGMHHHHQGMGRSPMIDSLVLDGGMGGMGGLGGGVAMGAVGMPGAFGGAMQNFVVSDLDHEPGRQIVQDYGFVEGYSGGGHLVSEDEKLSLAITSLTTNAQAMGANAVLQVETGEDVGGQIVVRGRAVLLS